MYNSTCLLVSLSSCQAHPPPVNFCQTLEEAAPSPQMFAERVQSVPVNYALRMQQFHKRSEALHVALVFDGASDPTYTGPGFQLPPGVEAVPGLLPGLCQERPTGLDLYPAMFSWPCDEAHTAAVRTRHWPSVVMTITSMQNSRDCGTRCVYDDGTDVTYFVRRVGDPLVFAVAVFHNFRPENETGVRGFLAELGGDLNVAKVFTTLRQKNK